VIHREDSVRTFGDLGAKNPGKALLPDHWRLVMNTASRRLVSAATLAAMVLGLAACGGGGDGAESGTAAGPLDAERATALARRRPPPPPPPPPAPDANLVLASASAAGLAADGAVCGLSADGGKVLFGSTSASLVSGDTNGVLDLFLKDFNGNGVTRVVAGGGIYPLTCLALTPSAGAVAFIANVTTAGEISPGTGTTEAAIMVKNLVTGVQTRVTPPRNTFANVDTYQFAGLSDDGLRVAFFAQPTRTCSGYDCTANGPARLLLRDITTGQLSNLESQVRFTTSQGFADGDAWLSPNGRTIAFSSRVSYPEAGDTNPKSDVFAFDIASGNVRLVSTDAAGNALTFPGFVGIGPVWGVQAFLANSSKIAFSSFTDTSVGPAGVYVKDLATGALNRILGGNLTYSVGNRMALSFSDDGRKVAYVESTGNTLTGSSVPRVLDITTGVLLNAATLSNGTVGDGTATPGVLLSRDGRAAAFDNNASNLVAGANTSTVRTYRRLLP
jgi:Tol biopolymer transport system component